MGIRDRGVPDSGNENEVSGITPTEDWVLWFRKALFHAQKQAGDRRFVILCNPIDYWTVLNVVVGIEVLRTEQCKPRYVYFVPKDEYQKYI